MDQFIVYNNIEIFDAAAPPAGEKVSFPPPNDMWRANIISSARRRSPAGSTSNAVWLPSSKLHFGIRKAVFKQRLKDLKRLDPLTPEFNESIKFTCRLQTSQRIYFANFATKLGKGN